MKTGDLSHIKVPVLGLSSQTKFYFAVLYLAGMWLAVLIGDLINYFYPGVTTLYFLLMIQLVMLLVVVSAIVLSAFYRASLGPDGLTLTRMGIFVRTIPASQLRLLCMVGNEREDVLCLSTWSIEELAQLEERKMLKNALTRHDVALFKRRGDWQDCFARNYLNRLRRSPLRIRKNKGVILLNADPTLQFLLHTMYPQLPYRNYTGVTAHYRMYERERNVPCFTLQESEYSIHPQQDGIHIRTKKEERWSLPAEQIRTIVRVDRFGSYEKFYPHHMPILIITSLSAEELASRTPENLFGAETAGFPNAEELLAQAYCRRQVNRWTIKNTQMCPMHGTDSNAETLRSLYPHARWIDLSANWLENSDG